MQTVTLESGDQMPLLGIGTWKQTGSACAHAVETAIKLGYRHVDTAKVYGNHREVARGVKKAGIDRESLFITSKIWNDMHGYESAVSAGKEILKELDMEYLDLLLIHWPVDDVPVKETLGGLEKLKEEGVVRNIGVSNFTVAHLEEALDEDSFRIANNQIKIHPYEYPEDIVEYCRQKNITVTAYSPLARGRIFDDEKIKYLSKKCDRSPSQLVLKWLVEKNIIVIPKATSEEHIKDNMGIFGWRLSEDISEKMDEIAGSNETN